MASAAQRVQLEPQELLRAQAASKAAIGDATPSTLAIWTRANREPPPSLAPPVLPTDALAADADAADARLIHRLWQQHEALRYVPPDGLPPHIRSALSLERQLPALLPLQRRLRAEVAATVDGSRLEAEAADSLCLRRVRRLRQPREQREVERVERKRQLDVEAKRKRRRDEWLAKLVAHQEEFKAFHRESKKLGAKLAKSVLADFDTKARRENKERERAQRERLKALRENNIEAYMQLIADTKNTRITQLLEETDRFLKELGAKVHEQKAAVASAGGAVAPLEEPAAMPSEPSGSAGVYTEGSTYYKLAHAVDEEIVVQPTMLKGGELKEYQLQGLRWLVSLHNNNLNGILADEMGLGKTIQTIALIAFLIERKHIGGPYMVIVPLAVLSNWQLELQKWAPGIVAVIYKGGPEVRREIFERELNEGRVGADGRPLFNVLVTTYELVMKDKQRLKKFKYQYIIIDEGHRMKNATSKLSSTLLQYESQHRILLTGTPLQNSLHELWALLNFLLPKIFASSDSFETWFSAPLAAAGGGGAAEELAMSEEESLLVINRLHQVLRPFLLRRLKSEVEAQLPGKAEYVIKCDLSAMQRLLYRQMQEQGLCSVGEGGQLKVSGLNNVEMQLRKVCNHPFLFFTDEQLDLFGPNRDLLWRASGKFELLDRILPKLKALDHRVLIFSQMVQLMNLLERYLDYRGHAHLRLDGNTRGDERGELLAEFNKPNSPYFIFMLSTRAGGLGLNLQTADTVILFDSDWNPQIDLQAMARAHRIGQQQEVRVLRLVTASPIEEKILATANEKLSNEAKYIEAGKFNQTSDASERREMLQRLISQSADEDEDLGIPTDPDINMLLARPNAGRGMTQDQEVEAFGRLDAARVQQDPYQVRLVTHEELPPWLIEAEELRQATRDTGGSEPLLDGPRDRKRVSYGEELSERDFNRMLQSGLEQEEFLAQQQREREQRELREEAKRAKRASASASASGSSSAAADDKSDKSDGDRKPKAAKMEAKPRADATDADMLKRIVTAVATATRNKRRISSFFLKLPTDEEAPGYYQEIAQPVSLAEIREKIRSGNYSLEELDADIGLMVRNAKTYNTEDSQVYQDACAVSDVFSEARNKHASVR